MNTFTVSNNNKLIAAIIGTLAHKRSEAVYCIWRQKE